MLYPYPYPHPGIFARHTRTQGFVPRAYITYMGPVLRPVTMEARCSRKKLRISNIPAKYFCTARYEHKSSKKQFHFSKTPKKIIPGQMLGQDRPEKNSTKGSFEAARFRVLDRYRSTKPTTAPCNLNGARSLGAPTHPLATVFTKRPVVRGGRRPGV